MFGFVISIFKSFCTMILIPSFKYQKYKASNVIKFKKELIFKLAEEFKGIELSLVIV